MEQYMIKQTGPKNCGVAVTKMLLATCFNNAAFLRLNIKENLSDFSKIKDYANQYDLALQGSKTEDFEEFYKNKSLMIIQISRHNLNHFLLIKRSGKHYRVNDPGYGSYLMTKAELLANFTGFYLELINDKIKRRKPILSDLIKLPIARKSVALFIILHLFSLVSLFVAVLILDNPTQMYFSILLVAFSFMLYILSRHFFISLSQGYDQISNTILETKTPKLFLESFNKIQGMKAGFIAPFLTIFTSSVTVLMLLILLGINDVKLLIIALLLMVSLTYLRSREGRRIFRYFQLDELISFASIDMDKRKDHLQQISDKTHKYIQKNIFFDIIVDAGIVFLLMLVMAMNQLYSLNYLLLYFCLLLYLKSNIKLVLSWPQTISEYYNTINQLEDIARKG
jgi:hypothetical protein